MDGVEEAQALQEFKDWAAGKNREFNERGQEKYEQTYGWTKESVVEPAIEPSPEIILKGNAWVAARWIADLSRNPDYKPSPQVMQSLFVRNALEAEKSRAIYQIPDYISDIEATMQAGPEAWREYSQNTKEDLMVKYAQDFDEDEFINTRFGPLYETTTDNQVEIKTRYEDILEENTRKQSWFVDYVVPSDENHPVFPFGLSDIDDENSMLSLTRRLAMRLEGTQDGKEIADWMVDNFDFIANGLEMDEMSTAIYTMKDLVGKVDDNNVEFYSKFMKLLSSAEYVEVGDFSYFLYKTTKGKTFKLSEFGNWDAMRAIFNINRRRTDFVDALICSTATETDVNLRNRELAVIFGNEGFADTLNYAREIVYDEQIPPDIRDSVSSLTKSFWHNVVTPDESQIVAKDVEDFIERVVDQPKLITAEREGEKRIEMLLELFDKERVKGTVVELAGGNGWLTAALAEEGYDVVGTDMNETLVKEARNSHPNIKFEQARFNDVGRVLGEEAMSKVEAVVITGRSANYLNSFEGFHDMMSQISTADLIVFDALDTQTGTKKDRIENFRDTLEQFGYNRGWLDRYMWQSLASMDGKTLSDRWVPPQDWWENMMGLYGYEIEVQHEEDYDGQGTDNMVFICRKADKKIYQL